MRVESSLRWQISENRDLSFQPCLPYACKINQDAYKICVSFQSMSVVWFLVTCHSVRCNHVQQTVSVINRSQEGQRSAWDRIVAHMAAFRLFTLNCSRVGAHHVWTLDVQPVPSYVSECKASFSQGARKDFGFLFLGLFFLPFLFLFEVTLVKSERSVKDSLIHEPKAVSATDQLIDTAVPRLSNDLSISTISPCVQRNGHPEYLPGEVLRAFLMRGNPEVIGLHLTSCSLARIA